MTDATRAPGVGNRRRTALHIIGAMSRPLRLPPLVRAPLTLVSAILLLVGGIPVATYPFAAADAAGYRSAIGVTALECAHDAVPADGGCWSAVPARVTIAGVDHLDSGDLAYLVVQPQGRDAVRENLAGPMPAAGAGVGATVTLRYWHADIAMIVLPAATGAAPVVLPTRDNPSWRTAGFPTGDAVAALLGILGLAAFGVPLAGDVRRWRRRRQIDAEADAASREATTLPGFARGLARYGMSLAPPAAQRRAEAALTGHGARPAREEPAPAAQEAPPAAAAPAPEAPPPGLTPGGAGWNIRTTR